MDLGFIQAGFKCKVAFDHDHEAIRNYKHNIGNHIQHKDLKSIDGLVELVSKTKILVAGPPCQGFSTAGKNDPNDIRNIHIINTVKLAAMAKPEFVVIENVKGLLGKRYNHYWTFINTTLINAGYTINWGLHDSSNYGVAQSRKRIIIIASQSKTKITLKQSNKKRTLRDALTGINTKLNHTIKHLNENSDNYRVAKKIKPGQKLSNVRGGSASIHTWHIPEVFGHLTEDEKKFLNVFIKLRRQIRQRDVGDADPLSQNVILEHIGLNSQILTASLLDKGYLKNVGECFDITNGFNGKFRRLEWDKPSLTVDTRFGQPRYFLHPEENRGFTVREAARIQGFPDDYEFLGNETAMYRMIGNAVPVPLAKAIADSIKQNLGKKFGNA